MNWQVFGRKFVQKLIGKPSTSYIGHSCDSNHMRSSTEGSSIIIEHSTRFENSNWQLEVFHFEFKEDIAA